MESSSNFMLDDSSDRYLPEQEWRLQYSFLSAMCCVDWVYHEYHTPFFPPQKRTHLSKFRAVNSASFPTEVRLVAMTSISLLAILALETDHFALLGQHLDSISSKCFRPHQDLIWRPAQSAQVFSRPVLKCWKERGRVVWGRAVYLWPTEHTFHAHWSESMTSKQSREQPAVHGGFRSRGLVGILIYLLFLKYCSRSELPSICKSQSGSWI